MIKIKNNKIQMIVKFKLVNKIKNFKLIIIMIMNKY